MPGAAGRRGGASVAVLGTGEGGGDRRRADVRPPVTVTADADIAKAARLVQDRKVKRLPVADADGRLAGIVSRTDVLSVYERPDEQIRDEITRGVIAGRFRLDPLAFEAAAKSGIVTITGHVDSREVALNLLGAVRNAEEVVAVRGRVIYPPG